MTVPTTPPPIALDDELAPVQAALHGQYDVLRVLGAGGMGTVYLARERLLERLVAVKVLSADLDDSADGRARFLREARTAAGLAHPNIVPLYSFVEAGPLLLYIMGYVEGESLKDLLDREPRLSPEQARAILADVASALAYAHGRGVVHRDVKPDNVLIEAGTGRAVLTDFGIARQIAGGDSLTQSGLLVGTPQYMSPEQAGGDAVDGRSDVYSLGMIGYRMLTGSLPFGGSSLTEVLAQRMTSEVPPIASRAPALPDDLAMAITRALRRDRDDRWLSADAMCDALRPPEDGTVTLPERLERLPGIGTSILLLLAMMWIVVGAIFMIDRDPVWLRTAAGAMVLLPLGIAAFIWTGRREGYPVSRVLSIAFWPPAGWIAWWPRALRRPGDVWDRLPTLVKVGRVLAVVAGVSVIAFHLWMGLSMLEMQFDRPNVVRKLFGKFIFWFPVAIVSPALCALLIRTRFGVREPDLSKLLIAPLTGAFWKRPRIAALLGAPARHAAADSAIGAPRQLAEAIARLASDLPASLRDSGDAAAALAREAAQYDAGIDRELAQIASELDASERESLRRRLSALETARGNSAAPTPMMELLREQLRMIELLESRRAQLVATRDRLRDGLRQLWLQLASRESDGVLAQVADAEVTERMRALCRQLDAHNAAAREVSNMLAGDMATARLPA